MIPALSLKIARMIKAADPEIQVSVEKMAYELGYKLNLSISILLTLIIGFFTHEFLGTVMALATFCTLRYFSGGLHLSLTWCTIVTPVMLSVIPHIDVYRTYVLILTVVAALIYFRFAPNFKYDQDFRLQENHVVRYKLISIALVLSNLFIQSDVIALATLLQGAFILPIWRGGKIYEPEKTDGK